LLGTSVKIELEQILYNCVCAQLDLADVAASTLSSQTSRTDDQHISPGCTLDRILEDLDAVELQDSERAAVSAADCFEDDDVVVAEAIDF
jgi:BRCT domain type II-containing protein